MALLDLPIVSGDSDNRSELTFQWPFQECEAAQSLDMATQLEPALRLFENVHILQTSFKWLVIDTKYSVNFYLEWGYHSNWPASCHFNNVVYLFCLCSIEFA